MADTKSAKLDQDFGLSPDDPLSKLANFFVVSDDPLGPGPAPDVDQEPVIDMEQELLPMRDEGEALFEPAGEAKAAEPHFIQPAVSAWEAPAQARDDFADAGMQDLAPAADGDEVAAGGSHDAFPAGDAGEADFAGTHGDEPSAPDLELDAEFAGLRWEADDVAADSAFAPADAEPAGLADDDVSVPSGEEAFEEAASFQAQESWLAPAADAGMDRGHDVSAEMPEPEAQPMPDAYAAASGGSAWEQPASGHDDAGTDEVLEEMMALDWSSLRASVADAGQAESGEAVPVHAGEAAVHSRLDDETLPAAPEDEWTADDAGWAQPGASHETPQAPGRDLSFAETTIEDELAALLAGEPAGGGRDMVDHSAAPAADFGQASDAGAGDLGSHADMPAVDAGGETAPRYVSSARPEAAPVSRQTNFGWAVPSHQQPVWNGGAASQETSAAGQPWNDGSPEPMDLPEEARLEPAAGYDADDKGFEFEGDFAEDFDSMDSADVAASDIAEAPQGLVEPEDEPEFDLPEFDESAFLDQSFIEEDLRLESHDPVPPAVPEPREIRGEDDFDIDADLLAEIESIQMEQDGDGVEFGVPDGASRDFVEPDAAAGQSYGGAARTGLAAGAAAAVGGLASRFSLGARKAAAEPLPPEIETTDVPESRIDVADDLDLPETAYQTDSAQFPGTDDLEEMLAGEELSDSHVAAGQSHSGMDFETFFERELEDAGISFGASKQAHHAPESQATARLEEPVFVPVTPGGTHGGYEDAPHDEDLERELSFDDIAQPDGDEPKSKRGLVIAAVVAGVALIGGIGAFALTGGGGDAGGTQDIVRADSEPVKVKPENPGGTKVPNQNRVVYEEAAGAPAGSEPQQDKLVSNAETPVDVRSRPVRVVAPGPVDTAAGGETPTDEPSGTAAPAVKSEDRIDPARTAQEPGPSNELAAVAPRRVRTYVVRPDGTLVATEAPAPTGADIAATASPEPQAAAVEENAGETAPVEAAGIPVPQPRPQIGGGTRPSGTPAGETAAPATVTAAADTAGTEAPGLQPRQVRTTTIRRDTVSAPPVVPERPADQPVNIVGTTRRDGQQVAAAAPAAGTGPANANPPAWVQIASQPSRELAQSSYRNLSQRFGGIIGGRGVNIVPAEIPGRGTFYRVNIPAGSFNEAASLCREIKAAGGDCLAKR
ncbi:MAG: hypothetical protein CMJ43_03095 [Phyllobacteriaceae bacterium]|nr:hypothetical protein [Phyllobacteriaceae bacterium]